MDSSGHEIPGQICLPHLFGRSCAKWHVKRQLLASATFKKTGHNSHEQVRGNNNNNIYRYYMAKATTTTNCRQILGPKAELGQKWKLPTSQTQFVVVAAAAVGHKMQVSCSCSRSIFPDLLLPLAPPKKIKLPTIDFPIALTFGHAAGRLGARVVQEIQVQCTCRWIREGHVCLGAQLQLQTAAGGQQGQSEGGGIANGSGHALASFIDRQFHSDVV